MRYITILVVHTLSTREPHCFVAGIIGSRLLKAEPQVQYDVSGNLKCGASDTICTGLRYEGLSTVTG